MSTEASENAAYSIMLRQIAPHLKQWFEWYSVKHNCAFHDVYLVGRYKPDCDMDDPKSALLELQHVQGGDTFESVDSAQAASGTSEMTLLQQMFPVFKEWIIKQAAVWNVSKYRVFLMVSYALGKDLDNADSINLSFRCKILNAKPGEPAFHILPVE